MTPLDTLAAVLHRHGADDGLSAAVLAEMGPVLAAGESAAAARALRSAANAADHYLVDGGLRLGGPDLATTRSWLRDRAAACLAAAPSEATATEQGAGL